MGTPFWPRPWTNLSSCWRNACSCCASVLESPPGCAPPGWPGWPWPCWPFWPNWPLTALSAGIAVCPAGPGRIDRLAASPVRTGPVRFGFGLADPAPVGLAGLGRVGRERSYPAIAAGRSSNRTDPARRCFPPVAAGFVAGPVALGRPDPGHAPCACFPSSASGRRASGGPGHGCRCARDPRWPSKGLADRAGSSSAHWAAIAPSGRLFAHCARAAAYSAPSPGAACPSAL